MLSVLFILSFSWQYSQIRSKKAKSNQDPNMPQMQHVSGTQVQTRQRRAGDLPDLRDFS
jgi:hypothetical protein